MREEVWRLGGRRRKRSRKEERNKKDGVDMKRENKQEGIIGNRNW